MKRIILTSVLFVLLIGASSLAPAKKYKYTSDEAKFSITFPKEFNTSEEVQENYKSVQAQAMSDEMVFLAIYTIHEEDITQNEELSEISFDAFMEGLNGTPNGKTTWKVKKNSGLKSEYEVSEKNLVGEYRVILVGQIQYQVTAVSPKGSWDDKKAEKFFKSFKLKK
ncbi:MAG: hypothetical protein AB8B56_11085 [Crocinitomicaceae bacterium]